MCMCLSRDHDLSPAGPLYGCAGLTCDRRSCGSSLAGVAQNFFPSFPEAHTHQNQCCVVAWVAVFIVVVAG
jgi:hypothetical protein